MESSGAGGGNPTLQIQLHACSFQRVCGFLFTHVGLALLLVVYAIVGAAVFQAIERPFEIEERILLAESRQRFLESMWNLTTHEQPDDFTLWEELASIVLRQYENEHARSVKHGTTDDVPPKWTFSGSLFFSCTVFTTIGYGHMAPETTGGRVFCMVYAFFGIPLLMLVLVAIGTQFARGAKFAYLKLLRCVLRHLDRVGKERGATPEEAVMAPSQRNDQRENLATETDVEVTVMESASVDNRREVSDEDVDIPTLAVISFGFLYLCALAGMLSLWEDWDYWECFYFSFITLSTIGFGDYVPEHPKFAIAASFLILLGMTIMTMCIALSQNKIQHSLEWVGWRIGVKANRPERVRAEI